MEDGKINVLHFVQGLDIGGLEIMVINLLRNIDRKVYNPLICCYDRLGILAGGMDDDKIAVFLLKRKAGIDFSYPFKLLRLLKRNRIDVLHLHNPTALFYGAIAGALAGVGCIVYTEHGRDFSTSRKVKLSNRFLCMITDYVVAVAEGGKRYLVDIDGVSEKKIKKIHNGIDPLVFKIKKTSKEQLGLNLPDKEPVIGIVARLDPIKNHDCLIRAMKTVVNNYPLATLLVIGKGPEGNSIRELITKLELDASVKLLGERRDIPELLGIMDIFVLSSYSEGLSLTLIEACAAGVPIVATDVGGNSEIVEHSGNGFLVPSNNPSSMARAIIEILADKERAEQMKEYGKRKFEKEFILHEMVRQYESLYASSAESGKTINRMIFSTITDIMPCNGVHHLPD